MVLAAGQRLPASAIEPRLAALETVPKPVTAFVAAAGIMSGTAQVATLTGAGVCGTSFVAPATGRVMIFWQSDINNNTAAGGGVCGWEIRTGGTVGSGTVVVGYTDADSIQHTGTTVETPSHHGFASGLTPGATYNVQLLMWINGGGTGTFSRRRVTIMPA